MKTRLIIILTFVNALATFSQESKTLTFPENIQGTWLLANGSKQWHISLYEDVVIYDGELYENYTINIYDSLYAIELDQTKILLKLDGDTLNVKSESGQWFTCKQYQNTKNHMG